MKVEARKALYNSDWLVIREYLCINGLHCWFVLATVHEADDGEIGYTDGAFGSAEVRANEIADALNSKGVS